MFEQNKGDFDFSCFDEPVAESKDYKFCPTCDVLCVALDFELLCQKCGEVRVWNYDTEYYSKNVEQNHTTAANDFMSIVVFGRNTNGIKRCLKLCSADYYKQSEEALRKIIEEKMTSVVDEIPDFIVTKTLEMYSSIRNTEIVFRSQGKWYIIAACMNYALIEAGIPKNRRNICTIIGITEKKLSAGENQLEKLNDLGIINIPLYPAPQQTFIEKYFVILDLPFKYVDFVVDLILCAESKYLHIKNESRPNSRCVGCIYMLCVLIPELSEKANKDLIADKCNISKSTFNRYYKTLCDNIAYLTEVFIKYDILLPLSWKSKIYDVRKKNKQFKNIKPVYTVFGFDY
jgi:transcription initiation factor TFIIIB Brf1 subunit/transcription initiation factor TFIIB